MTRLLGAIFLLGLVGMLRPETIVIGALTVGSTAGVYALIRVINLERRWNAEAARNAEESAQIHSAASETDQWLRGTDA